MNQFFLETKGAVEQGQWCQTIAIYKRDENSYCEHFYIEFSLPFSLNRNRLFASFPQHYIMCPKTPCNIENYSSKNYK